MHFVDAVTIVVSLVAFLYAVATQVGLKDGFLKRIFVKYCGVRYIFIITAKLYVVYVLASYASGTVESDLLLLLQCNESILITTKPPQSL